jgi:hypothetical protein
MHLSISNDPPAHHQKKKKESIRMSGLQKG